MSIIRQSRYAFLKEKLAEDRKATNRYVLKITLFGYAVIIISFILFMTILSGGPV